ncbi:LytR/AlgR family response regulator transcription factor [Maricaulis sp. CAU 1757]
MTRLFFCLLLAAIGTCLLVAPARAQSPRSIDTRAVLVCPVAPGIEGQDFNADTCEEQRFWDIDPQGRHLWLRANLTLDEAVLAQPGPHGLHITAKASSEVWFNGERLGNNGEPGPSRTSEIPGRMDSVFHVPRDLLRAGDNEIVLRLSAHHGWFDLASPLHRVFLGPYDSPTTQLMRVYWPSLVTFGVFVIGVVFFGVTAWRREERAASAWLALASGCAALQLSAEVVRGLWAYPYPMHEVRLGLILIFAFGFGLSLLGYLLVRSAGLAPRPIALRLAAIATLAVSAAILTPGFDGKTGYVLLTWLGAALAWSLVWAWQRKPGARLSVIALAGVLAVATIFPNLFIDRHFYYAAAALLLVLFQGQARSLVAERRQRALATRRADRLEAALARARQAEAPARLQLISAGRVDYVATDAIVQLKAAGDYVELHGVSGEPRLYTASLGGLESELPATFLRVHRSHIVNTAFVKALERDPGGGGRLRLTNGTTCPVSRRILPRVRNALAET